jgi:hypothetical protein
MTHAQCNNIGVVSTTAVSAPGGHYSQGIAANGQIFVSGQLPIHADGASLFRGPVVESKLARGARQALIAATQRLTPEERLQAFLRHCRLMMALHRAGQQIRSGERRPGP